MYGWVGPGCLFSHFPQPLGVRAVRSPITVFLRHYSREGLRVAVSRWPELASREGATVQNRRSGAQQPRTARLTLLKLTMYW